MATSTSASAGGIDTGGENCLDGSDNDGDIQIDCADPNCMQSHSCHPVAEAWEVVRVADDVTGDVTCPSGFPTYLYGEPGGAFSCAECSCGELDLSGVTCSQPALACYSQSNCAGQALQQLPSVCGKVSAVSGQAVSCQMIGPSQAMTAEGCAPPRGGGSLREPPMWGLRLGVCDAGAVGGGCDAGEVCLADAPAPLEEVCLLRDGSHACPAGYVPHPSELFRGGEDTRVCSECGCEADVICSGGGYGVHQTNDCGDSPIITVSTGCKQASYASYFVAYRPPEVSGSCAVVGGEPEGAVMPAGEVTLCCPEP